MFSVLFSYVALLILSWMVWLVWYHSAKALSKLILWVTK